MVLIEIYSKKDCPACDNAKRMLREKNTAFIEYMIGTDITREAVLEKFPGVRNAPVIVVDGVQIKEPEQFQMLLG